jgi:hypothetical protein
MCVPLEYNFRPLFRWYPHLRWGPPSAFTCFCVYTNVFRWYGPPELHGRLILGRVGPPWARASGGQCGSSNGITVGPTSARPHGRPLYARPHCTFFLYIYIGNRYNELERRWSSMRSSWCGAHRDAVQTSNPSVRCTIPSGAHIAENHLNP